MKSQQSYHWLFAAYFGKNKTSRVPWEYKDESSPNVPEEYTTVRGVGELTNDEIAAVDEQLTALSKCVRFRINNTFHPDALAETTIIDAANGQQGHQITITIDREYYKLVSKEKQTLRERRLRLFALAVTILHETAHAAHMHCMGSRCEDFFEDALVAEAGFDYISHIFGILPVFSPEQLDGGAWMTWQNIHFLTDGSYPIEKFCRNGGKLSTALSVHPFDVNFAKRLLSDEWWAQAEDRSADLIPKFLLHEGNAHILATAAASFRAWVHNKDKPGGARDTTPARKKNDARHHRSQLLPPLCNCVNQHPSPLPPLQLLWNSIRPRSGPMALFTI